MRANIAQVTGDLGEIHMAISKFELSHDRYPTTLAEVGMDQKLDPWGKNDVVMANDRDFFGLACQYDASGKN